MAKKATKGANNLSKKTKRNAYITGLACEFLHEWCKGNKPKAEPYLNDLPDEAARDQFKQIVGFGMILKTVLPDIIPKKKSQKNKKKKGGD